MAEAYEFVTKVRSRSAPDLWYDIKAHPTSRQLSCGCTSYRYSSESPKCCKHILGVVSSPQFRPHVDRASLRLTEQGLLVYRDAPVPNDVSIASVVVQSRSQAKRIAAQTLKIGSEVAARQTALGISARQLSIVAISVGVSMNESQAARVLAALARTGLPTADASVDSGVTRRITLEDC